jgi:membrane protease YdiL (CAAX protease family)
MKGYVEVNIKVFIQRHSIVFYFILAYTIAWGGSLALVGPKFLRGDPLQFFPDGLFMFLPMLAGPSIAGITMTYILDGNSGLRELFSRMRKWQVGMRWYAVAILIPLVLIFAILLILARLVSPVFFPVFSPAGILIGLFAGFFEEIGWMGFVFPKMERKNSPLVSAIYLGLLWTVWHAVADYLGASQAFDELWLLHFLVWMVATFTAMRVLIVWVYTNTRSLLLAQLMHACSSGFLYILVPPLSPTNDILFYGVYAVVL